MAGKATILLVEDDMNLGFVVQDALKQEGYKVTLCTNGTDGLKEFAKSSFSLCLLDVMLPQKDGFTLAQDIREINSEIPVVFLTAKAMDEDKVKGFKSGADDYITKPFNMPELLLRIEAILRRVQPNSAKKESEYSVGSLTFDTTNFTLSKGKEVLRKLTKKEAEILKLLCKNEGNVVERSLILKLIWGEDNYFNGRSLDVFITKLRKYLKDDVEIVNMHGIGFKLGD